MMAKQSGKKTILNENTQHLEAIQKVKTLEYANNIYSLVLYIIFRIVNLNKR